MWDLTSQKEVEFNPERILANARQQMHTENAHIAERHTGKERKISGCREVEVEMKRNTNALQDNSENVSFHWEKYTLA